MRPLHILLAVSYALAGAQLRTDLPVAAFEEWSPEGSAFSNSPAGRGKHFQGYDQAAVAFSGNVNEVARGSLTSPAFTISRRYLNFLVSGERDDPRRLGVQLLVDGRIVRSSSGTDISDLTLHFRTFDVGELSGRTARIRIVDESSSGSIAGAGFSQSDSRQAVPCNATKFLDESFRPQFHYAAHRGWLNDPNGLFRFGSTWHLFHQYRYPGSGGTAWAHSTSKDLVHWSSTEVALRVVDGNSNYSGSAAVDWDNRSHLKRGADPPILLFYSLRPPGVTIVEHPSPAIARMTQRMAYSVDGGKHWLRFAGNPILRTPDYRDRDPKVFFHRASGAWIMVLSLSMNNAARDRAHYGIFRSQDLRHWDLTQSLGPGAWFWECPDMYELPVDGDPAHTKWVVANGKGDYLLGTFDGREFHTEAGPFRMHWGGSYYATQTFADVPGGRRVQIAWMSTGKPNTATAYPGMPFNQQMSFPRDLTLRTTVQGVRIFRYPVPEIETLYNAVKEWRGRVLEPGENALEGIDTELLDLDLEAEPGDALLRFRFRGEEVVYDPRQGMLSAFHAHAPVPLINGKVSLRILMDRASIEVFGNRGQADLSGVFFPDPSDRSLSLTAEGGAVRLRRLVIRSLRSIYPR